MAFWNAKSFPSEFLKVKREFYPNLFSDDCSNVHSNAKEGFIYKINIYNGLGDQLQTSFSQRPIKRFGICEKLLKSRDYLGSKRKLIDLFESIESQIEKNLKTFHENLDNINDCNSPLRAEFRFPLERLMSMTRVVDSYLTESFVLKHSTVLSAHNVKKIIKFWIAFLKQPLLNAMYQLYTSMTRTANSESPFETYFPTISSFESLLVETLFTGTKLGETAKVIWAQGKKCRSEGKSLNLMKRIKELNRLDFKGEAWASDKMEIRGEIDIVKNFFKKKPRCDDYYYTTTARLFYQLRDITDVKEKAKILWNSYFNHLHTKYPEFFIPNNIFNLQESCKLTSLHNVVRYSKYSYTLAEATRETFNYKLISSCIDRLSSPFHQAYLVGYKLLADESVEARSQLDNALLEIARELGIEFIHAKGLKTFFSDYKSPKLAKIHHRIDQLKVELNLNRQHFISEAFSTLEPPKKILISCKNGVVRKSVPFDQKEKIDLLRGYNAALDLEFPFCLIRDNPFLVFRDGQYCGKLRIPEDLRRLYNRLKNEFKIELDEPSGYLYLTGSNIEECALDVDKIRAYMVANPAQNKIMDLASSIAHYENLPVVTNNDLEKEKEKKELKKEVKEKPLKKKKNDSELDDRVGLSIEERKNLCIGLNTFKNDKSKFMKIATCKEFGFLKSKSDETSKGKSNDQLKAFTRSLVRNGSLKLDSISKSYYLNGYSVDDFRAIVPAPIPIKERSKMTFLELIALHDYGQKVHIKEDEPGDDAEMPLNVEQPSNDPEDYYEDDFFPYVSGAPEKDNVPFDQSDRVICEANNSSFHTDPKVNESSNPLKSPRSIDADGEFKSSVEQIRNVNDSLNSSKTSCDMKTPVFEKEIKTDSNEEEFDEKEFIRFPENNYESNTNYNYYIDNDIYDGYYDSSFYDDSWLNRYIIEFSTW